MQSWCHRHRWPLLVVLRPLSLAAGQTQPLVGRCAVFVGSANLGWRIPQLLALTTDNCVTLPC
jgi:hypothetical protein